MNIVQDMVAAKPVNVRKIQKAASGPGQIVLVLQGGGALGAYQAGVYQALHEAGLSRIGSLAPRSERSMPVSSPATR